MIDAALEYLNALIAKGTEYPDAHYQATRKYAVAASELQAAYDGQYA